MCLTKRGRMGALRLSPFASSPRFLSSRSEPNCSTKCLRERFPSLCNSIIRASIEKGSPHKALLHYKTMLLSGITRPDHRTLALILKACRNSSNLEAALAAHARITKTGFHSHGSLRAALFRLYIEHGGITEAQPLFDEMLKCDFDPVYANLMIKRLLRSGEFEKATRVFSAVPIRDLVTWNSMIAGCVRYSRPREAISHFRRMINSGFKPDAFTFSAVLSACARIGALDHGQWVHRLMAEKGVEYNHILGPALIDMYAKCGKIEVAQRIFDTVSRGEVSIWNSMITGLAIHGLGSEAIQVFSMMEGVGLAPDGITFVGILTACSHSGMIEEVRHYFDVMKLKYMMEPQIEHYGAMVDALARAGLLKEAYDTIKAMPMEPDIMIWRALLSACRKHRQPELAELVIGQMPRCDSGDYAMLSSIYSSARRWDCAERVWGLMKERRVRKSRGLSWVELGGTVHQFKAGDRSHPESDDILRVLNALTRRIKADGFMPMTELVAMDVSEEEREENLNSHSEKLAVAFSVLRTGPGMEIRVSKNLQTCMDCHVWIKMVSKLLSRVIIVRDRLRFHRFERGCCSCRDYW